MKNMLMASLVLAMSIVAFFACKNDAPKTGC